MTELTEKEAGDILGTNYPSRYCDGYTPQQVKDKQNEAKGFLAGLAAKDEKLLQIHNGAIYLKKELALERERISALEAMLRRMQYVGERALTLHPRMPNRDWFEGEIKQCHALLKGGEGK